MKKRLLTLSTLAVALILAACNGDLGNGPPGPPGPPTGDAARFAQAQIVPAVRDPDAPIRTNQQVSLGNPQYYRISLPANVNEPLLYFELVPVAPATQFAGPIQIEVFDPQTRATPILRSVHPGFFGEVPRGEVPTLELQEIEEQAILVDVVCRGPCIIARRPAGTGPVYVKVSTNSAAPVRYNLHAYDDPFQEVNKSQAMACQNVPTLSLAELGLASLGIEPAIEPQIVADAADDQDISLDPSSIIVTPVPGPNPSYHGAIEFVGNTNCYRVTQPVNRVNLTTVDANVGITIAAVVFDGNTNQQLGILQVSPQNRTDTLTWQGNRPISIRVFSSNWRAGPSGTSGYFLDF